MRRPASDVSGPVTLMSGEKLHHADAVIPLAVAMMRRTNSTNVRPTGLPARSRIAARLLYAHMSFRPVCASQEIFDYFYRVILLNDTRCHYTSAIYEP